jgi:histidinol-phosphate aminotransferase
MHMKIKAPPHILSIKPYIPGKPIEALTREYGIEKPVKLASNENPLGPSPKAVAAIVKAAPNLNRYPDDQGFELIGELAHRLKVKPANVILGNGSDDLIGMLSLAFLQPGDEVVIPEHSFSLYETAAYSAGANPIFTPLSNDLTIDLEAVSKAVTSRTRMVFFCTPHNPTGAVISRRAFEQFISKVPPQVVLVVDEAYIEFATDGDCLHGIDFINAPIPVVTLRTFSKAYGLAGLRIGYGVMSVNVADLLNRVRQPFNTNLLAQAGALAALKDDDFLEETKVTIHHGVAYLSKALSLMGFTVYPTQANFILFDVGQDADAVFKRLLKEGVIVRSMASYGFDRCIRVNAGLPEENERLIEALAKIR